MSYIELEIDDFNIAMGSIDDQIITSQGVILDTLQEYVRDQIEQSEKRVEAFVGKKFDEVCSKIDEMTKTLHSRLDKVYEKASSSEEKLQEVETSVASVVDKKEEAPIVPLTKLSKLDQREYVRLCKSAVLAMENEGQIFDFTSKFTTRAAQLTRDKIISGLKLKSGNGIPSNLLSHIVKIHYRNRFRSVG